jgi:voltage-gated potassium channel
MFVGAILFMSIERVQGGDGTFLESLWWSFTTLVTGGFADIHNPQTIAGKILTVMLVIGGMVLVGVFTATLTTVLVRDDDNWQRQDLDELNSRIRKLEEMLLETNQKLGVESKKPSSPK